MEVRKGKLAKVVTGQQHYTRTLALGESSANHKKFPSNRVQTARYESIPSLVVNGLIRCIFSSAASVYFFIVGLLQMFTPWSPTGRFATMGPYAANKVFEMISLYWYNDKSRRADYRVNSRNIKVITRDGIVTKHREDLEVGDLVYVEEAGHIVADEGERSAGITEERLEIPADLLLIYSQTRSVFLDMSSLTGEKDSVQRKVPNGLNIACPDRAPLYGIMYTKDPTPDLDAFKGELRIGVDKYDCNYENIMLAGSYLFKGKDVYGMVIATGKDTKIRLKQKETRDKTWSLQASLNWIAIFTIFLLGMFIMLGTIGHAEYYPLELDWWPIVATYFLLFNGLIAQTLQFTLDIVRGLQCWGINVEVKNPIAVEQLGLTQAIVFDKTGTLTQNKLEPQVWSVMHDELYYIHDVASGQPIVVRQESITGYLHQLLLGICLNNSVMRSQDNSARPNYFGTSADEVALLESAYASVGYFIKQRQVGQHGEELILHLADRDQENTMWDVLHVYRYTSKRGMMTVLVRNQKTKQVYFYSKGSPEMMYPYLCPEDVAEARRRVEALAVQGLRVLLYAFVQLDWSTIEPEFIKAKGSPDGVALSSFRKDYLRNMRAIGATGTEDQLHPHLSETIGSLQQAGIIALMCTGDVKLTAEIIGKNCGILPKDGPVFDIQDHPDISLVEQLERAQQHVGSKGVLVGKEHLNTILEDKSMSNLFFELVRSSRGVVTYRAHPKLKAQLTKFLMQNNLITCSVGDGANDIDMIKQANVGIGIKDGENSHAAGSADLAIKRVGELPELIFVHGKQNWESNTTIAHMINGMKLTVVLALLYFDFFYSNFASKALFKSYMLIAYNVFYGWGTIMYGWVNRTVQPIDAKTDPQLFQKRPDISAMSWTMCSLWWLRGAIDAAIALSLSLYFYSGIDEQWGLDSGLHFFNKATLPSHFCTFVILMFWVNLRVSLETRHRRVHAVVIATLAVFSAVAFIPARRHLPPKLFLFIAGMIALFFAYNWILRRIEWLFLRYIVGYREEELNIIVYLRNRQAPPPPILNVVPDIITTPSEKHPGFSLEKEKEKAAAKVYANVQKDIALSPVTTHTSTQKSTTTTSMPIATQSPLPGNKNAKKAKASLAGQPPLLTPSTPSVHKPILTNNKQE